MSSTKLPPPATNSGSRWSTSSARTRGRPALAASARARADRGDRFEHLVVADGVRDEARDAERREPLLEAALLGTRHEHHEIGTQRNHGFEARIVEPADARQPRDRRLLPRGEVVHTNELRACAERECHRGERRVQRHDAARRLASAREGSEGERKQEGGAATHGAPG